MVWLSNYEKVKNELLDLASKIEEEKRPGYTQGDSDVLYNFKKSGERLGISPLQAWGVHFDKHIFSIFSFIKDDKIPQGESLDSRFADALNYLKLGYALYREKLEEDAPKIIRREKL